MIDSRYRILLLLSTIIAASFFQLVTDKWAAKSIHDFDPICLPQLESLD